MELGIKEQVANLTLTDVTDLKISDVQKLDGINERLVNGKFKKVLHVKSKTEEFKIVLYSDDGWNLYTPSDEYKKLFPK